MISILLSTLNRADYLPTAIDSVFAQTNPDWELIISDDGSTDDTAAIVAPYLSDARIHYFRHETLKLPASRNWAATKAHGDFFAIIDSDDHYARNHLETNLQFMAQNTLDFCHSHPIIEGGPSEFFVADKNDLSQKIHINDCAVGGTFVFKRAVFNALGGFRDVLYSEDGDFFERAHAAGFKMGLCPTPTYYYHVATPDSLHKAILPHATGTT